MKKLTPEQLTFDALDSRWDPNGRNIYSNMTLDDLLLVAKRSHQLKQRTHRHSMHDSSKDENHES
ncbi:MAG: hypothetical protein HRT51_09475 [Colwellia sp.]|nr:hypothetical protein [Colwellia sp.]